MDEVYHLKLRPTHEEFSDYSVHGFGPTLIQTLASLEAAMISTWGAEAAFENHCCFLNRDIVTIVDDLAEEGGVFTCNDFSDPEGAFTITRLPNVE